MSLLLLSKYLYSLVPAFVVLLNAVIHWYLNIFGVSNTTSNNQWENCISLDFNFCGLSEPRKPSKLEPHDS